MNYDHDVGIVGAGPVGLAVANLLGQQGIDCVLIEQNENSYYLPRAQTLDDEGCRTLQAIGIAASYLPKTRPANGSNYYDADGNCFTEIGPGPQNYGFPKRNYMLQQELDTALLHKLGDYPNVTQYFTTQLVNFSQDCECVRLTLQSRQEQRSLRVRYLLACDGGRSFVRRSLGIEMIGWTYSQDWLVLDTIDDPDQSPVSRFFCDPARPAVSIASPRGGRRYEFMLLDGETAEQALAPEFIAKLLAPFRPYDERVISRKVVYTFHARIAERLQQQRVLLLGDAAHLSPPFAGQGMNAGLRDAHNVAWKLGAVLKGYANPKILQTYASERREPIWAMIQLAVAMGEFVMPRGAKQLALKNSLMEALERFPEAKDYLLHMKFKPRPRYKAGVFLDLDQQVFEVSLVGEMIPQPWVVDAAGKERRLDDVLGSGFALVAQDDAGEDCIAGLQQTIWEQLKPNRVRLYPCKQSFKSGSIHRVAMKDEKTGRPLRTHRDQVLLIRPDRYALGAFFPAQADAFSEQLQVLLD